MLAAVLLLHTAPELHGQQAPARVAASDSIAARRLTELVGAINSGSSATMRSLFRTAFILSPDQLQRGTLDRMVAFYSALYDRSRGFEVHDLQLVAPTEAAALLQSNLTGSWESIGVRIEPEPPHRIADVGAPSRELPLPPSGVSARTDAERVPALDEFMNRVAGAKVFSGVVLLAKDDSVLFLKAYGEANKKLRLTNRTDTRFGLASITKMFTAVAIAQLVEQGKLSFEDPLSKYLPSFRNREAVEKVQLKHLLSHTSGIPDYLRICQRVQPCPAHPRTLDDYLTRVELAQADTLMFEPGTRWAYSNASYVLLGKIVEIVSGQPYPDYVREHVFRPAGMRDTDFFQAGPVPERLAKGYEKEFTDEGVRFREGGSAITVTDVGSSEGGAYGTAEDLLRFALALRAGKLVGPQYVRLLASPKPELKSPSYGYGVSLEPAEGIAGHGGTGAGASTSLDMFLHSGHTAVVLSNYSYARTLPREHVWRLIPDP
jgi:CubicO group peptidase (beta-lactamase class C family)